MKNILRQEILTKRNALTQQEVEALSAKIIRRLLSFNIFQQASHVMLYLDFRNEVKTGPLVEQLLQENKKVLIPVTNPTDRSLIVSELMNPSEDLFVAKFGLLEPNEETIRPVNPHLIDVVLVPGLVFDENGYRIGFGAGYYDRFLPSLNSLVPLISMLYEFQIVKEVPKEHYDIPVHYLITEKRIVDCRPEMTPVK